MTDREKKELIEAEETILQLFFDAYERAMKYTKGNINLSLRMAAMLVSAMVHDQTESKSFLKRRDYKDSTDLILWEYIIRRLTPLECCRLQGFPDNWAEELGITEPTQEDIDHWREVFRTQMEAMGESKKEKTDNQICKWLKDPESDSAKYKMWGNGIALPCAMFVMEGIAMILSREDTDE